MTIMYFIVNIKAIVSLAEADACKIEHDISQQTFEAICRHAKIHIGSEG